MSNFKKINKKNFKKYVKLCFFCDESNLNVLDVHRIFEGSNGGEYKQINVIVVCSNCHRKIHSKEIIVIKKHVCYGSKAHYAVECFINGKEEWKPCDY
jgi:hypothetical protein